MPVGFVFLGVVLIFVLLGEYGVQNKLCFASFLVFTMSAYFVKPLNIGAFSLNFILIVSAIVSFVFFSKCLLAKQMFNVFLCSTIVSVIYLILTSFNSDYITTLNPYPIFFVLIVFGLINLKNFKVVVCFVALSYLILSFCNLFVESGLGYVHFASLELFNLMLVVLLIMLIVNLMFKHVSIQKRRKLWKSLL